MVQYTLAQCPEVILTVSGRESAKAREKAMDQLIELMEAGKLPTDLADGFGPKQLIEVKEPASLAAKAETATEDEVTEAVQVLSHLATLKMKLQASRAEAMQVRDRIDILFSDDPVDEAEIAELKNGFKTLKTFAQNNLRYRQARSQAEEARKVLDRALSSASDDATAAPTSSNGKAASTQAIPKQQNGSAASSKTIEVQAVS